MSLTSDMYTDVAFGNHHFIDPDWLAGAMTGLTIAGRRSPSWLWDPFLDDIIQMSDILGGVRPVDLDHISPVNSLYDVLGGYVSVTGTMSPDGLHFRLSSQVHERLRMWFPGLELLSSGEDIVVPLSSLPPFLRLVPIRGPVEDGLLQEGLTY